MQHAGTTVGSGRIGWILQNPDTGIRSGGEIGRLGEGRGEGLAQAIRVGWGCFRPPSRCPSSAHCNGARWIQAPGACRAAVW
eukprot:gene38438-50469_t